MQKDKKNSWTDFSPVILGEIGAILLVFPYFVDVPEAQAKKMFVAALALIAYAGLAGTVGLIAKRKNGDKSAKQNIEEARAKMRKLLDNAKRR